MSSTIASTEASIDTVTDTVVANISVGRSPGRAAISPDGAFAYVPNEVPRRTLSVIDTATKAVVATVPVGHEFAELFLAPDGMFAYVTASIFGDPMNVIWVFDTSTWTEVATIDLGTVNVPGDVAFTPDGRRAYVAVSHADVGGSSGFVAIERRNLRPAIFLNNIDRSLVLQSLHKPPQMDL